MAFGPKSESGVNLTVTALTLASLTTTGAVAVGGNETVAGTLTVTGATALNALTTVSGRLIVNPPLGAPTSLDVTNSRTGQTANNTSVEGQQTGSYDTTAAQITAAGVAAESYASRSAGANPLINIGMYAAASGGQTNYAIYAADTGDVSLCGAADKFTVGGPATFLGLLAATPERKAASGALSVAQVISIVSGTASLMTLADGTVDGQMKILVITSGTGTLTPAHMTTGTVLTWSAGKSGALLIWDATAGKWSVPLQVGCPIT